MTYLRVAGEDVAHEVDQLLYHSLSLLYNLIYISIYLYI
jgi:hypothetical protein